MKHLLAGLLLGALSCAAAAQQAPTPLGAVTVSGTQPRIQLPDKPYRMWASDFRDFKGLYRLENGNTLYLSGFGHKMYARVAGQDYAEIVASGPTSFVALNQQMAMEFLPATGAVTDVRLHLLAAGDQAHAGDAAAMITLLAHR